LEPDYDIFPTQQYLKSTKTITKTKNLPYLVFYGVIIIVKVLRHKRSSQSGFHVLLEVLCYKTEQNTALSDTLSNKIFIL
jgi:hypothetical protein